MKRILLISALLLFYWAGFSQANIASGAISIQGIARDANNNALVSTTLSITAEVYYLSNNTPVSIELKTGQVTTDGFGVFAYVMDISKTSFTKIANTEAYIRVLSGTTKFADEKLRMVPYAVHAQNGVPTGTILPFAGTTVPEGWLLCDGSSIPSGVFYDALKSALGNATNVPDLRGMFLRGAGTNGSGTYANNVGPALRAIQADATGNHTHPFTSSSATTSSNGDHTHNFAGNAGGSQTLANGVNYDRTLGNGDEVLYPIMSAGAHTHTVTVSGTTNNQNGGAVETRPVNFGVNYIIKI